MVDNNSGDKRQEAEETYAQLSGTKAVDALYRTSISYPNALLVLIESFFLNWAMTQN
ncbi:MULTISPECIES: hypothetical protein [unclassified Nostoc]|uniref:hypothetical protein n=1 Tax=unclassified Nostoc TaxID=2593658 RepID=UPI001DCFFB21|nr:hypothetical protein [Nostoc sp. JL34]MBN3884418.1 hypothetical protein [Nostoc sp. JL34]